MTHHQKLRWAMVRVQRSPSNNQQCKRKSLNYLLQWYKQEWNVWESTDSCFGDGAQTRSFHCWRRLNRVSWASCGGSQCGWNLFASRKGQEWWEPKPAVGKAALRSSWNPFQCSYQEIHGQRNLESCSQWVAKVQTQNWGLILAETPAVLRNWVHQVNGGRGWRAEWKALGLELSRIMTGSSRKPMLSFVWNDSSGWTRDCSAPQNSLFVQISYVWLQVASWKLEWQVLLVSRGG